MFSLEFLRSHWRELLFGFAMCFLSSFGQTFFISLFGGAIRSDLGISDGESLYAVRYSTAGESRSLFHSANREVTMEIAPEAGRFSRDARAIVSEPLNDLEADWIPVPEASFLTITRGDISCEPFTPILP